MLQGLKYSILQWNPFPLTVNFALLKTKKQKFLIESWVFFFSSLYKSCNATTQTGTTNTKLQPIEMCTRSNGL